MPIPLHWFVVHPHVHFWRHHKSTVYIIGVMFSYLPVGLCVVLYRHELFNLEWPLAWRVVIGLALIVFEGWVFWWVARDLGGARLVGKTEPAGGDIVDRGIYARIRYPRYTGSSLAIVGACFLARTPTMWVTAAAWLLMTLAVIQIEEQELRSRFNAVYDEYCRCVPRFLPLRTKAARGMPTSRVIDTKDLG